MLTALLRGPPGVAADHHLPLHPTHARRARAPRDPRGQHLEAAATAGTRRGRPPGTGTKLAALGAIRRGPPGNGRPPARPRGPTPPPAAPSPRERGVTARPRRRLKCRPPRRAPTTPGAAAPTRGPSERGADPGARRGSAELWL